MKNLASLFRAAAGELSLSGSLGRWGQAISRQVEDLLTTYARTAGGINQYVTYGTALTGPFTLDAWTTLAPATFTPGDLSDDLVAVGDTQLQYTGSTKLLILRAGVSVVTGEWQKETYEIGIFRNGALISGSRAELNVTVIQDAVAYAGAVSTEVSVLLNTNDVLDIRIRERLSGETDTVLSSAYLLVAE